MWYALISKFLQKLEFRKTDADYIVVVSCDKLMFILVYMNNFLIISKDLNIINGFKNKLLECFYKINFGSIFYSLRMFVTQIRDSVSLD